MNYIIDICGKRTPEYISDSLAKLNRGIDSLTIRAIGGNISEGVEIGHILCREFGVKISKIEIKSLEIDGIKTPYIEITLNGKDIQPEFYVEDYDFPRTKFVDFPVYHLLLDWWLFKKEKLELYNSNDTKLITIIEEGGAIKCQRNIEKEDDEGIFYGVRDALYRCGLIWPSNWKDIARKLSEFDDVILGVDTNILYNCTISEHLLPALSLIDPKEYVHTPNWILFVIPSAVMHELEEAANIRDERGSLQVVGRKGFRALQEIIELNRSIDIPGVSLLIVGEANPVLDIRVEIQGLREDFYKESQYEADLSGVLSLSRSKKSSSGDTIIRDQFKEFLQKLNFHKGVYFLTADKTNAALARAEGLNPIYFHFPSGYYENNSELKRYKIWISDGNEIKIEVPIGKLIYEMAVQFGTIKIKDDSKEIKIRCDTKGENLDYWIYRNLLIEQDDFNILLKDYTGKFSLKKVVDVLNKLQKFVEIGDI